MSDANQMPPWMFNLEGTFLGFLGNNFNKPKAIVLEVEQEKMAIKLPKDLRGPLGQFLRPGDRLRCIGRSQIDFKTGVIKLKAYQLFSSPPDAGETQPVTYPAVPNLMILPGGTPAINLSA
jgi:hypothetical protein